MPRKGLAVMCGLWLYGSLGRLMGKVMLRCALIGLLLVLACPALAEDTKVATESGNPLSSPCPYPPTALAAGAGGSAMVSYRGRRDGTITDVVVLKSSGNADLDQATVQCVAGWRFNADVNDWAVGEQRTTIVWKVPDSVSPTKVAQGYSIGIPHVCMMDYPVAELRAGIGGTSRVAFTVTKGGAVRDQRIEQSSGNDNLDAAALKCVKYWRYRPATEPESGKPKDVPWKADVIWKVEKNTVLAPAFAEPPPDCLKSYPVKAEDLKAGDGITEIKFTVGEGKISDAEVVHSSGNAALDRAALACITSRKYQRLMLPIKGSTEMASMKVTLTEQIKWSDGVTAVK